MAEVAVRPARLTGREGFTILEYIVVIFIVGVLVAVCPSFNGGMASGFIMMACAPLAGALLRKAGAHAALCWLTGLVIMAAGFLTVGAGAKTAPGFGRVMRRADEAATIARLADLRAGKPAQPAKLPPYHAPSETVFGARRSNDGGGWLRDEAGRITVNCTHTDSRGSVWTAY
jgi:hypothetical protein